MSSMTDESSMLANGGEEERNGARDTEGPPVSGETKLAANGNTFELMADNSTSRVLEYLQEAREEGNGEGDGPNFHWFKMRSNGPDQELDLPHTPAGETSPAASLSTPDDTPSIQGSVASSRASSAFDPRFSPTPSLRPFDRRFRSRLQPAPPIQSPTPRTPSPSIPWPHSRSPPLRNSGAFNLGELEERSAPWDVVRWTKLKKIKNHVFSEGGRRSFGTPTCIVVSATIALGTSKGLILVFDYNQNLQGVIGPGTKAVECGAITALAVSADHTTLAGGHETGHILTWELNKPSQPFLHIPPIPLSELGGSKVNGHVEGVSVLHLGFLGTRHTALVSGDNRGMAFSHLATRGLGVVRRIVKTTRILGRYPLDIAPAGRLRKPSSVLAFSPLPLGNSPQATDSMGLVALLTPNLLVIVSTTPIAQTQHKAAKPKEVATDSALSGCLAWYPFMKPKQASSNLGSRHLNAKLVYAWSNVLTLLELSVGESEDLDPNRPPLLDFRPRSRFRCDEAIVAVQWVGRQIIGVLTVTQRLIILEDTALRVTETFDLMSKQILHHDMFSEQLRPLVGHLDDQGSSHPHTADAFYNSFKTYKGRIFLLCQYEVLVGALSNWADRLLAMMEVGDFIGAIQLATAYYIGEADKLTIGLPEDSKLRHSIVEERLLEMMSASLRYAFGKNQKSSRKEILERGQLQDLATACFNACLSMGTTDFLFDETFEHFEQGSVQGIFLETLEPHILDGRIRSLPPTVVKSLIAHYTSYEFDGRLEEIICHLDTKTLDIDQVTTLCKKHNLYDAMIYVWNQALGDYITPMIDLLSLLIPLQSGAHENENPIYAANALKVFPYLSYTLTGRVYPTGEDLSEPEASNARASIYYFLFLGRTISWPKHGGKPFLTDTAGEMEPSFPYLRLILRFDSPSFLSALNEAFEDPFLNGPTEPVDNGFRQEASEEQVFCRSSMNRQYIVSILLEVMGSGEFQPQDTIYLDMFIARNIPKYPQFVLLSGSALHRVIVGLCNYPSEDIAEDSQLSVEYLLTAYRPPDIDVLVELFSNARFYRVLKSIFRSEKQYARLIRIYFEDEESREAVFDCIWDYLRPGSQLNERQIKDVRRVIELNARQLLDIDCARTANIISSCAPDLHGVMLSSIEDNPQEQFQYLQTILEPPDAKVHDTKLPTIAQSTTYVELYIRLMCEFEPDHVSDYVGGLQSGDLRLEMVLPAMESSGAMDAAVLLMAREGQIRQAMDRLIAHLETLEAALASLLVASADAHSSPSSNEAIAESLRSLQKYAQVGVWLCQGQMKARKRSPKKLKAKPRSSSEPLNEEEMLWLDFLDAVVRIAKNCISIQDGPLVDSIAAAESSSTTNRQGTTTLDSEKVAVSLRLFVQDTFSALLAATSSSQTVSFLRILRAFLLRASEVSPSLGDLRNVLGGIFEAYIYEKQILALANRLLEKDLFVHVGEAASLRKKGWRPTNQTCEACTRKLWGPGAAGRIYSSWEKERLRNAQRLESIREERRLATEGPLSAVARGKSRARATTEELDEGPNTSGDGSDGNGEEEAGELVLFKCRHIFHRKCLDNLQVDESSPSSDWAFKCIVCRHSGY